jgi:hypothetical protein
MRAPIAFVLPLVSAFLATSAPAQAKFAPLDPAATVTVISFEDTTINSGPAGAMLESNYFNAQQPLLAGIRVFPCRLQTNLFQKTSLVRACN